MLLKKLKNKVYLFIDKDQYIETTNLDEDVTHCIGLLDPKDARVTDPELADTNFYFIDVTARVEEEKFDSNAYLAEDNFTAQVMPAGYFKFSDINYAKQTELSTANISLGTDTLSPREVSQRRMFSRWSSIHS